jgi:hypothetical protein
LWISFQAAEGGGAASPTVCIGIIRCTYDVLEYIVIFPNHGTWIIRSERSQSLKKVDKDGKETIDDDGGLWKMVNGTNRRIGEITYYTLILTHM